MEEGSNTTLTEGWLIKDCVVRPGKDGNRGDKIVRDVVGNDVFDNLVFNGVLSATEVKPKNAKAAAKK